LKGFKSKNNKSFEASLKIENDKVVFDFPSKDKQKGGEK
ncbi:topoisomerase C-terminal repeat-containing protein, partial [Staphylococcus epidermidis]